jgi:hypothetical protein
MAMMLIACLLWFCRTPDGDSADHDHAVGRGPARPSCRRPGGNVAIAAESEPELGAQPNCARRQAE